MAVEMIGGILLGELVGRFSSAEYDSKSSLAHVRNVLNTIFLGKNCIIKKKILYGILLIFFDRLNCA